MRDFLAFFIVAGALVALALLAADAHFKRQCLLAGGHLTGTRCVKGTN